MKFVLALNAITTQIWAIIVLCIGCGMIVYTKKYGIDGTIAGGIVGVAANMLTGPGNKQNQPGQHLQVDVNPTEVPTKTGVVV